MKYHERVKVRADEHKQYFLRTATRWLKYINNRRGTLNPRELNHISTVDQRRVELIVKALKLYKHKVKNFTLNEFEVALQGLNKAELSVISSNYIYPASHVGKILKLPEKIGQGLLHSALSIECAKPYLSGEPELMTNIITDIANEVFY